MQARLDGAERDVERPCDLLEGKVVDEAQREYLSPLGRQAGERAVERVARRVCCLFGRALVGVRQGFDELVVGMRVTTALARARQREVLRDRVEVSREASGQRQA